MGMGWGPSQVLLLERQSGRDRMTGRWGFTLHPEKPCRLLAGRVPLVFEKAPAGRLLVGGQGMVRMGKQGQ